MARKTKRRGVRGKARRRVRKKAPLGVLIWTAIILFVLVVFLFTRVAIGDVMDRTELLSVLQRSVDNAIGRSPPAADAAPLPVVRKSPPPTAAAGNGVSQPAPPREPPYQIVTAEPAPGSEDALAAAPPARSEATLPAAEPTRAESRPATVAPHADTSPSQRAPSARQRRIFFAAVSDAGEIAVTGVMRTMDDTTSPLTETLKTLFAGPVANEVDRGLTTMIPPAVTLNRVYVRERIAYIDVSESFRFNPLGREGLDVQLEQLVFSATEFPGVEMVQILIDGSRVDFLGPEGTYIGEPVGRAMFFGARPATP